MPRTLTIAQISSVATIAGMIGATAVWAQQLNPGLSCISGDVPAYDYAELTSNYRESIWDTKAAMRLVAESSQMELSVTDDYGTTVCEDAADMKVRCKFKIAVGYSGIFNIKIDSTMFSVPSRHRLCAE
jgi:hypothetical protein